MVQTSKLYTPPIFEAFQGEYERSLAAYSKALDGDNTYIVDSTLDILCKQIEEMIITCPSTSVSPSVFSTNDTPPNDVLSNARLKKKEVQTKTSKRRKNWLDKKRKFRKKERKQSYITVWGRGK